MDDDNYDNNEDKFGDEFAAFDRVGIRTFDFETYGLENTDKKKKTPLQRFLEQLNAICIDLIEKNIISDYDKTNILETLNNISRPEYKNASAYILGYIATNGGNELTVKRFNSTTKLLKFFEDTSVDLPAIVRYSRLWINLKKIK